MKTRIETDSLGEVVVPADALYGAQTQRALDNFGIGAVPMPSEFIHALSRIKWAAARSNGALKQLDMSIADAIAEAAEAVCAGQYNDQFPVDVYQTGSGTSSNMNINEVLATLANRNCSTPVHPNDHVNMSQSSNDVVPAAIRITVCVKVEKELRPAIRKLVKVIEQKAVEYAGVIKTGRTHLMDAVPIAVEQELSAWAAQLKNCDARIADGLARMMQLPLGGTAVGTGLNAPEGFATLAAKDLATFYDLPFCIADNLFEGIASQDSSVEMSGHLNTLAVTLTKIANDLRWMNSGPLSGLAEIELPKLQPGSSIMPGKVNPVIPEAVLMAAARVMGNHVTVSFAGASGNFQLNVMLPLIAYSLVESTGLLAVSAERLATKAIAGMKIRAAAMGEALDRNPMLVTALNRSIGYEKAAAIARQAYAEGRSILDVAMEESGLDEMTLRELLDPARLTGR